MAWAAGLGGFAIWGFPVYLAALNACILALIARRTLLDGSGMDEGLARGTAYRGTKDRAALVGSVRKAHASFGHAHGYLGARVNLPTSLPIASLDKVPRGNGWRPFANVALAKGAA
jgi:hypothetical protein